MGDEAQEQAQRPATSGGESSKPKADKAKSKVSAPPTPKQEKTAFARVIVQRVQSASLLVDNKDTYVDVGRGLVFYVCWLAAAPTDKIEKMAASLVNVRLCLPGDDLEGKKTVSLLECGGDALVVPQFTLGGRMKGRNMQYHRSSAGDFDGAEYYRVLVEALTKLVQAPAKVCAGVFGNRQGLRLETHGPFSHVLDFDA